MRINFTKREYRRLLELVYLGDWMLNARDVADNPETADHRELRRKLYSYYKDMQCEDLIEPAADDLYETRQFEDAVQEMVRQYDEETFWDELAWRLADRDAEAAVGFEELRSMDGLERIELIDSKRQRWIDELERHGLGRFRIADE